MIKTEIVPSPDTINWTEWRPEVEADKLEALYRAVIRTYRVSLAGRPLMLVGLRKATFLSRPELWVVLARDLPYGTVAFRAAGWVRRAIRAARRFYGPFDAYVHESNRSALRFAEWAGLRPGERVADHIRFTME